MYPEHSSCSVKVLFLLVKFEICNNNCFWSFFDILFTYYPLGHPYHTEGLTCLAITSDSSLALTGSKDSTVHIVNITTGKVHFFLNISCNSIYFVFLYEYATLGQMRQVSESLIFYLNAQKHFKQKLYLNTCICICLYFWYLALCVQIECIFYS